MPVMTQEQREALETDIREGTLRQKELMTKYSLGRSVIKRYVKRVSPTGTLSGTQSRIDQRAENAMNKGRGKRSPYRQVWERKTGLQLPTDYMAAALHVHHVDGDHKNNEPENLCLLLHDDHTRAHATGEDPWQYQDRAIAVLMEHEADPYDGRQGRL